MNHAQATRSPSSDALALVLRGGPAAPCEARSAVGLLLGRIDPDLQPLTDLLVTELVTNSVKHGGASPDSPVNVDVVVSEQAVRVEVSDRGDGFTPAPSPTPAQDGIGGWGLVLVDRSAARWGTRHGGRCVWFELERDGPGGLSPARAG